MLPYLEGQESLDGWVELRLRHDLFKVPNPRPDVFNQRQLVRKLSAKNKKKKVYYFSGSITFPVLSMKTLVQGHTAGKQ